MKSATRLAKGGVATGATDVAEEAGEASTITKAEAAGEVAVAEVADAVVTEAEDTGLRAMEPSLGSFKQLLRTTKTPSIKC